MLGSWIDVFSRVGVCDRVLVGHGTRRFPLPTGSVTRVFGTTRCKNLGRVLRRNKRPDERTARRPIEPCRAIEQIPIVEWRMVDGGVTIEIEDRARGNR